MSIPYLPTTTISSALDASQRSFAVGSTSGITGAGSLTTPQSVIVVGGEAMLVQKVPVSGWVEVDRGFSTIAKAHPSGQKVYVLTRAQLAPALPGGPIANGRVGLAGDAGTLPAYRLPLGCQVPDDDGNILMLCDFTETVHSGQVVSISNDGNFTVSSTMLQGAVGVVQEQTSTSDQWGWVMVYGYCTAQEAGGTSGATSAYEPVVSTTAATPPTGMYAIIATTSTPLKTIYGMFIVGAATTAVTAATSHTGTQVPVFLNFPYILQANADIGFS